MTSRKIVKFVNETRSTSSTSRVGRRKVLKGMAAAGVAALATSALGARRAYAAGRTIKIGFVSPETGPIAPFGEADNFVLEGVRKAIGDGIVINGMKHPVVIIQKDSQSKANRASSVAAELISGDKVDILVAGSTADTTIPVASQAELNGVPCLTADTPWQAWFFGQKGDPAKGFEWAFHHFWGVDGVFACFDDMWKQIDTNKVVGWLAGDDNDGRALGDKEHGFPAMLKAAGYTTIDLGLFDNMTDNFSAQITKLKNANVEIVCGVFYPPTWATFWNQAMQQGFRPKAVTPLKALLFPASADAMGDRVIGHSTEVWWSPHHPFKSGLTGQTAKQLCDDYTAVTGKQWTQPTGFKHSVLEIAIDVLKRTKDVDNPTSIRDAILESNYNSIVGPLQWKAGPPTPINPVKNVCVTPVVGGQWRKGSGKFKYDLTLVATQHAPEIKAEDKFLPLQYGV